MDLNALLQLLSQHMGGGNANNPFASLMKLLSGSGLGGNVNALNSGGGAPPSPRDMFGSMIGGGAPPSARDLFGSMLSNGAGGSPWNMHGDQGGAAPTNALGSSQPRLQFFGGGAGGIYPQQGYGQ